MSLKILQPSRTTIMIKPVGALCNLDCTYCYYLPTKTVYDGHEHKMTMRTLEDVFAGFLPQFGDEVTISWQGGEPMLAGLEFFEKAVELQKRHGRSDQTVKHAIQTNGTLLDEKWCQFLNEHHFLVGLSIDGPPKFHDHYRVNNHHQPSSKDVFKGLKHLQRSHVEFNLLCVLNNLNVHHPDEIFQYLLTLGTRWLQFIPAIEWEKKTDNPTQNVLAPYCPEPRAYGQFLCRVFDLWFERYRQRISVRIFDAVLMKLVSGTMPFCILDGSCHTQLTVEHDGAVFLCDHFIERRWQVAQVGDLKWQNMVNPDASQNVGLTVHGTGFTKDESHVGRDIDIVDDVPLGDERQLHVSDDGWFGRADGARLATFAQRKQHLPEKCRQCEWKPYCYGGCPKHRPHGGEVPEPSILCEAYIMFYEHAMPRLQWLADFLRRNEQPPLPQPRKRSGRTRKNKDTQPNHTTR